MLRKQQSTISYPCRKRRRFLSDHKNLLEPTQPIVSVLIGYDNVIVDSVNSNLIVEPLSRVPRSDVTTDVSGIFVPLSTNIVAGNYTKVMQTFFLPFTVPHVRRGPSHPANGRLSNDVRKRTQRSN